MGEVYRARDTKLNRDVAIKVLPEAFLIDANRVARFTREAQVLASLNHPNIAAIYGVEDSRGVRALVLELVEGPTLADRIRLGPIPVDEARQIAGQLAVALAAAHDAGIIHRDLKPSNIKVREDGATKVLDFGLAKLVDAGGGNEIDPPNATASPTVTSPAMMTGHGLILGTAAYMSPEQAKGRPADKRSDIWAFGCVLYEMLTGKRAFEGEDVSDTLAAVLRSQPDMSALPGDVPEAVRLAVSGCLEKDRNKRFADIAVVQFLLAAPTFAAGSVRPIAPAAPSRWGLVAALMGAAAVFAALVGVAFTLTRPAASGLPVTRFTFRLPDGQHLTNPGRSLVALSPDGSRVAYVANRSLYLKTMWDRDPVQLVAPGLGGVTSPVFDPEGRWIAYWFDRALYKVAVTGGTPVKLCGADNPVGMSWSEHRLLMGSEKGILSVGENGGAVEVVVKLKDDETAHGPQLLPDGRSILFTLAAGTDPERWDTAEIDVQTIGTNKRKTIIRGGADARYLPNGDIVYAVGGALFAVPFNIRKLEIEGAPTSVVSGVSRATAGQTGIAQFSVSSTGSLAYLPGPASLAGGGELVLLDRNGNVQPLKFSPKQFQTPRFNPTNGQQLAVGIDDAAGTNIWLYDLSGVHAPHQLTIGGRNRFPAWTRDGTRIAFQSNREGDEAIFWQRADGSGPAERLTRPQKGQRHIPESWSPDGDALLFSSDSDGRDFALQYLTLHDRKVASVAGVTSGVYPQGSFSPDGRWIVYIALNPARYGNGAGGLFVRPFPVTDVVYRVRPGASPFWAPVGKSLYFVEAPGVDAFSIVNITTEPAFEVSEPSRVPRPTIAGGGPGLPRAYDAAPDNQHLLIVAKQAPPGGPAAPEIEFILNWFDELKNRVK
jgi:serine/threonine-protein kinase